MLYQSIKLYGITIQSYAETCIFSFCPSLCLSEVEVVLPRPFHPLPVPLLTLSTLPSSLISFHLSLPPWHSYLPYPTFLVSLSPFLSPLISQLTSYRLSVLSLHTKNSLSIYPFPTHLPSLHCLLFLVPLTLSHLTISLTSLLSQPSFTPPLVHNLPHTVFRSHITSFLPDQPESSSLLHSPTPTSVGVPVLPSLFL